MEYPDKLRVAFSRTLRAWRERNGLTQEELARKVGTSTSYIGYLEAGRRMPTLGTFLTLAKALHVEPIEMLGETCRLMTILQGQKQDE